jgi:hypothetical protein
MPYTILAPRKFILMVCLTFGKLLKEPPEVPFGLFKKKPGLKAKQRVCLLLVIVCIY